VVESGAGRNASAGFQMHHLLQQIYCLIVEVLAHLSYVLLRVALPLGECHFHLRKICEALPGFFGWCAERPENLKDLPNF
jgi:hypothetical protein